MRLCSFHMRQFADVYPGSQDAFPSFAENSHWDQIRIIRAAYTAANDIFNEFNYLTELSSINDAYSTLGVNYSRKTHAPRGSAAVMSELAGVAQPSIASHGGWTGHQTALDLSYLTNLRRDVIRALAGFDPNGGQYWLPRDIDPPEALLAMIFPQAHEWYVQLQPMASLTHR